MTTQNDQARESADYLHHSNQARDQLASARLHTYSVAPETHVAAAQVHALLALAAAINHRLALRPAPSSGETV